MVLTKASKTKMLQLIKKFVEQQGKVQFHKKSDQKGEKTKKGSKECLEAVGPA